MKIAMTSSYYFPHLGGTERYVHDLSSALVARGHSVTVFTHTGGSYRDHSGVKVERLPAVWTPYVPVAAPSVANAVKDFDIHHTHIPPTLFSEQTMTHPEACRVPLAVTFHCDVDVPDMIWRVQIPDFVKRYFNSFHEDRMRQVLSEAQCVIATTKSYAQTSRCLQGIDFSVIPIGINLDPFDKTAWRSGLTQADRRPFEILYVGRLTASKGVVYLIQAARILQERGHHFQVTIVGTGEDLVPLKAMVAEKRLESVVHFAGRADFPSLVAHYLRAGVFVLPSFTRAEAFGIVQLEALALGCPLVTSDLPGMNEIVRRTGGGYLVPPRNPEALADQLAHILEHPAEAAARAEAGREAVRRDYSWEHVAQQVEQEYLRILEGRDRKYA